MLRTVTSASKRRTISTTRPRDERGVRARCAARARCSPPVANPRPDGTAATGASPSNRVLMWPAWDVGGHLCQRGTGRGEGDRRDQPFDDGSVREHHWAIGGRTAKPSASSALRTALPRSIRMSTPSLDATRSMAPTWSASCRRARARRGRRPPRSMAARLAPSAGPARPQPRPIAGCGRRPRYRSRSGPQEPNTAAAASNSRVDDVAPDPGDPRAFAEVVVGLPWPPWNRVVPALRRRWPRWRRPRRRPAPMPKSSAPSPGWRLSNMVLSPSFQFDPGRRGHRSRHGRP